MKCVRLSVLVCLLNSSEMCKTECVSVFVEQQ